MQDFLKEIKMYLKDEYTLILDMTIQSFIFPRILQEGKLITLIFTIAKQVIFKARHNKHRPDKQHFHSLLKLEVEKEYRSAIRHKLFDNFSLKWGTVSKIISEIPPQTFNS